MWHRTFEQYRNDVRALLVPLGGALQQRAKDIPINHPDVGGRVLAESIIARVPVPAFDNSQMDGYAVRAEDLDGASTEHPVVLPLGAATAAGDPQQTHYPQTASPIMTGAAIPRGADSVVPVERTLPAEFLQLYRAGEGSPAGSVSFVTPVKPGTFVRAQAESIEAGSVIIEAGTPLTPSRIGASAAAGVTRVKVLPRLRVLLCSTGDELADDLTEVQAKPDSEHDAGTEHVLPAGKIYDANTPMLMAALRSIRAKVQLLRCGDDPDELREQVAENLGDIDLVITSGGISKGAYEVVRDAFEPLGISFGTVAMQPGGPQGLGILSKPGNDSQQSSDQLVNIPMLCFPGNPVSSLLTFELFVKPVLRELGGLSSDPVVSHHPLAHEISSPADKHQIRRGVLNDAREVIVFAPGSHLIGDLGKATVLVHIPVGIASAPAGNVVETWRFDD